MAAASEACGGRISLLRSTRSHQLAALQRIACRMAPPRTTARCSPPQASTEAEPCSTRDAPQLGRRLLAAAGTAALLGMPCLAAAAAAEAPLDERSLEEPAGSSASPPDTSITHKVYFDIGVCQQGFQGNRTLGDNAFCKDPESLGRVVIGLYGNLVPRTVDNFVKIVQSGAYNSTMFSKVLPGEYVIAGKQGSPRMGEVSLPLQLPPNDDLLSPRSFQLDHTRPGTVSLNLSHNEDDPAIQASRSYRNVSFLITTGPGPASSLDGENIVMGRVLNGMDAISRLTNVPTFKPLNGRLLALNRLGSALGDERADKTKKKWGKPLKPVLITDSGVIA